MKKLIFTFSISLAIIIFGTPNFAMGIPYDPDATPTINPVGSPKGPQPAKIINASDVNKNNLLQGYEGDDPCKDLTNSDPTCYVPLAPITMPDGTTPNTDSFPAYLDAIYRIGIGACFVLGVIMFTWAGIEYIVSESMGGKSDAKNRITSALIGLAIALVSYILLNTINPDLLKLQDISTRVK